MLAAFCSSQLRAREKAAKVALHLSKRRPFGSNLMHAFSKQQQLAKDALIVRSTSRALHHSLSVSAAFARQTTRCLCCVSVCANVQLASRVDPNWLVYFFCSSLPVVKFSAKLVWPIPVCVCLFVCIKFVSLEKRNSL